MAVVITVQAEGARDGSVAAVSIRDDGAETTHRVTVPRAFLERVAPGAEPAELVRASFAFLLEREPKESILREFDISVIGRYFPEYEHEIRGRLTG